MHVDALLENYTKLEIKPLHQNPFRLRGRWICRDYGHILCRVLPTILTILGYARGEYAMRYIPTILNNASRLQHFLRRRDVRYSNSSPRQSSTQAPQKNSPNRRHELRLLHYRRGHPEQILQLCLPTDNAIPALVHSRSQYRNLCCKSHVLVATSPQTLRSQGLP